MKKLLIASTVVLSACGGVTPSDVDFVCSAPSPSLETQLNSIDPLSEEGRDSLSYLVKWRDRSQREFCGIRWYGGNKEDSDIAPNALALCDRFPYGLMSEARKEAQQVEPRDALERHLEWVMGARNRVCPPIRELL